MNVGDICYCKLTGKKLIIQRVFWGDNQDPMLLDPERIIEKYLVRYWSKPQDKYFSHIIYPGELTLEKPIFDPARYGPPQDTLYSTKSEKIISG